MKSEQSSKPRKYVYYITGLCLILFGTILFFDRQENIHWFLLLISFVLSAVFYFEGSKLKNRKYLISSPVILVVGISIFILMKDLTIGYKIGLISFLLSLGFLILFSGFYINFQKIVFWLINPFIVLFFLGVALFQSSYSFLMFTFYIGLGIGIALLVSGLHWKLFGLIIPGCLMIGISPGLYFAWGNSKVESGLVNTGIFLVCFALGWGLITVFSKVQTQNFLWWPLIPGGILAMVGWGLYIGGSPANAVGFIGNTGSIGLIIFGIYILLMKRGIQR